jgi:hypothetical protein
MMAGARQWSTGVMFKPCIGQRGPRNQVFDVQTQNGFRPSWLVECVWAARYKSGCNRGIVSKICNKHYLLSYAIAVAPLLPLFLAYVVLPSSSQ